MILSHGNTRLKSGFSINKECITDEWKRLAFSLVYEGVMTKGVILKVDTNKDVINLCNKAHGKYNKELEQLRGLQTAKEKGSKKKGASYLKSKKQ